MINPAKIGETLIKYFPLESFAPDQEEIEDFLSASCGKDKSDFLDFIQLLKSPRNKDTLYRYANESLFNVPDGGARYAVFCGLIIADHIGATAAEYPKTIWKNLLREIEDSDLPSKIKGVLISWRDVCGCHSEEAARHYLDGLTDRQLVILSRRRDQLVADKFTSRTIVDWADRPEQSLDMSLYVDAIFLVCEYI